MPKIYESKEELPKTIDQNMFNWECKRKGCWDGPCFTQHDKTPRDARDLVGR